MLIDEVVAAIRAGEPVVVPTDTVYGLAADPFREAPVRALYQLKGRDAVQPTALVAAGLDVVLEAVPELKDHAEVMGRVLPGPFTLIVPNPARRFPWLTGDRLETIGVRVPAVSGHSAELLQRVGALVATSANRPGEPNPRRVEDIPDELRQGCGAILDVGALPGTPSTVLDLTGPNPVVLREGAVPAEEALERLSGVRG